MYDNVASHVRNHHEHIFMIVKNIMQEQKLKMNYIEGFFYTYQFFFPRLIF